MYRLYKWSIFDANLKKYEIFWMLQISLNFQSWALLWTFRTQKCSPFVLFSKNCHRDTVYRLYKWSFLMPIWKILKFSEFLLLSFVFSRQHYETFELKNVVHSSLLRKIVIERQCIDCINDHFWCQFKKIWFFSQNACNYFWIFIMGTVLIPLSSKM